MGSQSRSEAQYAPAAAADRKVLPGDENTDKPAMSRAILKPKQAISRPVLGAVNRSALNAQKPAANPAPAAKAPAAGELAGAKPTDDMASLAARKPRVPLAPVVAHATQVFRDPVKRSSHRAPAPVDRATALNALRPSSAFNVIGARPAPAKPAPAADKPVQVAGTKRRATSAEPEDERVVRARLSCDAPVAPAKPASDTDTDKPVQVAGTKRRASSAGPDDARVVRARTSRSVSAAPVERSSSARSDATAVDSAEAAKELAARAESDDSVFEPSGAESQKTAVEDLEQQEAIFNRPMAKPRRAFSTVRSLSRPVGLDLPEPKESETPKDWDDIDAEDKDDPLMVSEYVKEIFEYMRECEERTQADEHYMTNQPDLSWDMRRVLMNWIVQIHYQLRMLPETLFLAVNLIDRFLSKCKVSTSKLQLVGMTGLILACKYEETTTPHVDDFAFLAGNCYSVAEIRNTEVFMLRVLDFDMSFPSPMTFLRRVSKAEQYNMQTRTVAKYLMEVSLIDHRFMLYPPSQIAAAGICLARRMLHAGPWDGNLRHHSGYTEESLRLCIDLMLDELLYPGDHDFVYRKYTHKRYLRASIFCRDWVVRHRHEIPPAGPPVGDFPDPELIAQSLLF